MSKGQEAMDQCNTHCYCLICANNIDVPKMLDCQHTFCKTCIQMYYEGSDTTQQYRGQETSIPCPICRGMTKIPADGIAGLMDGSAGIRNNEGKVSAMGAKTRQCDVCLFKSKATIQEAAYYCSKCTVNLCDLCNAGHSQQLLFKSHQVIHLANKDAPNLLCRTHDSLQSKYFCLDCKVPVCTACILLHHCSHHVVDLRSALSLHRDNLRTLLNQLGPTLDKMEYKIKKLHGASSTHSVEKNGHPDSPGNHSPSMCSLSVDISNHSPSRYLLPKSQSSNSMTTLRNVYLNVENIRKVFDLSTATLEASQSRNLLYVYEDLVARIQTILDFDIIQIENTREKILAKRGIGDQLQSTPPSSAASTCSLVDQVNSDEILLEDNCTEPEPSLLIKPNLIWKLEKQRSDVGELYNPCDVDFLRDGSLIVAEYDMINDKNNRLKLFDQQGHARDVLAQGKIRPLGLAVTQDGNIVVTDCKDKRLKLYSSTGQLISEMGKGQFGWPYGVAVNSRHQIIVSDAFNDNISIYQTDGKRVKQFGSSGANSTQFKNPYHVAVDSRDNIMVSDSGNNCIKVFDPFGRFMFWTSEIRKKPSVDYGEMRKSKRKKLKGPRGICIDHKGNILVADEYSRVCMFDECGNFLRNILTDEDGVKYPEAICCSREGHIAVTEWNPNNMLAIKLFNMYE
ncbi:hypothetical protein LSH36_272g05064 [Paralvinella palmiformis]|uniref:Uncharacterized protein n=1 Tax=Paralvinella palmiformis TaxID=53620 RepID=A0AAD9N3P5_9ANNE|nr:hypothetical protein LSH36_272g05064 [Paralvinella palmiformis]